MNWLVEQFSNENIGVDFKNVYAIGMTPNGGADATLLTNLAYFAEATK